MKHDSRSTVLFDRKNLDLNTFYSQVNFTIRDQVTIHAINLHPEDQITFEVIYLKSGTMPEACECIIHPGEMPTTIGATQLMCGDCGEDGIIAPVRLTANNPVVVLDSPQGVILRAVYEGSGIGESTVWAVTGTETQDLTPEMRGCPAACCEPDPDSWRRTGEKFCDDTTGMVMAEYIDNCGSTEWREDGEVSWVPTGQVLCDSTQDSTLIEEVNNCGETRWVDGGEITWEDTGVTRCENHLVQRQQVNACGALRWSDTEETCGYIASYPLPCGGLAYRPEDLRDPDATVELQSCDGDGIAYIYPEPKPHARTPVYAGCEGCGDELLGFAVDGTLDWQCEKPTQVEIRKITRQAVQYVERNGNEFVLWTDGKLRPLEH